MNFFVVDTAFQMICAIEARDVFSKGQKNRLVIEARGAREGREGNLNQILRLVDADWNSVDISTYPRGKGVKRSAARLLSLLKFRYKYGSAKTLYIGTNSSSWVKRISLILGSQSIVRLDDGTATIELAHEARSSNTAPPWSLFTIFYRSGDSAHIKHNKLEWLRSTKNKQFKVDPNLSWIIGGAYSEAKLLTLEREIEILKTLIVSCRDKKRIVYLPHRSDEDHKLKMIKNLGVDIDAQEAAFENRLLSNAILPSKILGISSTALFTAKILTPSIDIYAVKLEPPPKAIYQKIAEEAESIGIKVLNESAMVASKF